MGIVMDNLRRWFDRTPPIELTPSQREALIDAIVLAIMVDGKEELAEYSQLIEGGESWKGGIDIAAFFNASKERAVEAMGNDLETYCVDISARLVEDDARELTFSIIANTVCSDGDLDPTEVELMGTFTRTLEIEEARASELTAQARDRHGIG